jgi:hypothetical protein
MPRSKSRKSGRRGTTAARTASSRARRDGQQGGQAATPARPEAGAGRAPAAPARAGQVPASGAPAGSAQGRRPPPGLTGPRVGQAAPAAPAAAPAEASGDLPAWAAKAAEKLLTVTCWLDPGEQGDPFTATIYFLGRRAEVTGKPWAARYSSRPRSIPAGRCRCRAAARARPR